MKPLFTQRLRSRCVLAATIALLTVSSQEPGLAQGQPAGQTPQTPTSDAQPQTPPAQPSMARIVVTAGRSTVLSTEFDVTRIAITNPGGGGGDRR